MLLFTVVHSMDYVQYGFGRWPFGHYSKPVDRTLKPCIVAPWYMYKSRQMYTIINSIPFIA